MVMKFDVTVGVVVVVVVLKVTEVPKEFEIGKRTGICEASEIETLNVFGFVAEIEDVTAPVLVFVSVMVHEPQFVARCKNVPVSVLLLSLPYTLIVALTVSVFEVELESEFG